MKTIQTFNLKLPTKIRSMRVSRKLSLQSPTSLVYAAGQKAAAANTKAQRDFASYKKMLSKLTAHRGIILANFYDSTRGRFEDFFLCFISNKEWREIIYDD